MNKTLVCVFIILLMTVIIMSLPLFHSHFGILDDIFSLMCFERIDKAKSLNEFWNIVCPEETGRLRPVYFIYNYFIYEIVGKSPLGFYIFHTLNLFIVFLWLFFITRLICNDNFLALIAPLLLFSSNTLLENYYTLGKAEVQLLFFGLPIIYLFFLSNKWLSEKKFSNVSKVRFIFINILLILSTFAFYGIKETAINYLPLSILWFCLVIFERPNELKRQNLIYSTFFVVLNLIALLAFILLKPKPVGYVTQYSFNIVNMKSILVQYCNLILIKLYYFWVCLFYWVMVFLLNVIFRKKQNSRLNYQIFFLFYFCVFLFIYLPWPYAMPKYIVMSMIGSVIFSLSILSDIRDYIKRLYKTQEFDKILLLRTLFFSILALVFLNLFYGIIDRYSEGKVRNLWDRVNARMMEYVAMNAATNSTVFLFCDDVESNLSISNSPKVLCDRNDIKFTDWAFKINPGDWTNKETSDKIIKDLNNVKESDLVCVTRSEGNIDEYQRLPLNKKASDLFHQSIPNLFRGHLQLVDSEELTTSFYPTRIYNDDKVERKPFSINSKKFSYVWDIFEVDKIYQVHNATQVQYDLQKTFQKFFFPVQYDLQNPFQRFSCKFSFFNFYSTDTKYLKFLLNIFPSFTGDFSGKFLNIFINDKYVCSQKIQPDMRIYMTEIPQVFISKKINNVIIALSEKINTSLADFSTIYVRSHSFQKGATDYILILGTPIEPSLSSSGLRRGIHLVIWDPIEKNIVHSERFDTYESKEDAENLNDVINKGPIGVYYIMSIYDEGTRSLTPNVLQTFSKMGINTNLKEHYRCGFGYIGVKTDSDKYEVIKWKVSDDDIVDISYSKQENAEKYFEDIIIAPEIMYISQHNNNKN